MDPTGEMAAFVRVVEHRSFTAAATALGLTPSALSKLVSRLENRLGVRLLHRSTRHLEPTPEGEIYYGRSRQILADIEEVEAEIVKARGAPRGRLHVNTSSGFAVHQLAGALPDFLQLYPDMTVELTITDRVVDLLTEPADVTIRAAGRIDDMALTARTIAEYERTLCASPAYLARRGTPRQPAELANHTCIVMEGQQPGWKFRTREGISTFEIAPRVVTDNSETALRLALAGGGIVRLGDPIVADPIRRGDLVPLLGEVHVSEPLTFWALYLAGRHRLPKLRVFLDFLVEKFSGAPWRYGDAGKMTR
jgi:DNA-binding transcriptional LysR family regulator